MSAPARWTTSEGEVHDLPPFSTDIRAAFEVVDKLNQRQGFMLEYLGAGEKEPWRASFGEYTATGKAAAHAICLAALRAVGR
jgi:ABA sandwich protein